ncbi:Bug family tripartite tricarboxylate transporter substrate binding protein [Reyranella soli]|uniref:MFS transporter n=1 Tax=Reyranella soli TaxID=1230389 RepID=A0A512ND76_9HYPH|nr:tripartite tricarboxylate transporter substrate binding protein [Reyranella soli]GEP56899.1 MFS transporter [Reyranella soli]
MHRIASLLLAALALAELPVAAQAQAWPDKPIRFIVPSPPGGGTDSLTRLLANKLGETLKWQMVVDNRPGAGGNLGLDIAAKATPDGYTIVMGESSNLAINPYLYRKLPFDPAKDVAPVVLLGTVPLVLVVSANAPFDSLKALVDASKKKQLTFASSGNGTVGHLVGEMWKRAVGSDMMHVSYKGAGPVVIDLVGGQVDLHFASLPAALPLIGSGKLRALATTSAERLPSLPNVPTLVEAGFPGFDYYVFYGVLVPAGTPDAIVGKLNTEIDRAIEAPDMRKNLAERGVDVRAGTVQQFDAFLAKERAKWSVAVKESSATVD